MAKHIVAEYGGKGLRELFAAMPSFEMVKMLLVRVHEWAGPGIGAGPRLQEDDVHRRVEGPPVCFGRS